MQEIRAVEKGELEKLLILYAQMRDADSPLPDRPSIQHVWSDICSSHSHHCLGFFEQQALLATCTLLIVPNLTRACRPYAVLENVVTRIDRRRQGIGQALLRRAMNLAWEQNCYKVALMSNDHRSEEEHFYQSLGFDQRGIAWGKQLETA